VDGRPSPRSACLATVGADGRLVGLLGDPAVGVTGLLGRAEELDGVGHDLDLGAALAVPAGPLGQPQLADDGDLPAFGEPFGAGGGQLVEADDVDEVGAVGG
jgi:hypothetical protein